VKDYLVYENDRNHKNHKLYERMLRKAFGPDANILVAHHLTFEVAGSDPIEIPSADTFMFDHVLMRKVFNEDFGEVMAQLALSPVETRDQVLSNFMELLEHHGTALPVNLTIRDT
jgi:hypothetical protein